MHTILVLLISSFIGFAQADATTCTRSVTYDNNENTVYLMEGGTRLMPLDTPNIIGFTMGEFSPDCQYVTTSIWYHPRLNDTVVWDLNTGARVGTFEEANLIPHPISWSPDSARLTVRTESGDFLWNPWTDDRIQVSFMEFDNNVSTLIWLPETTQLAVQGPRYYSTTSTVNFYNWITGELQETYSLGRDDDYYGEYGLELANDNRYVIIYGLNRGGIGVWDRQTGAEYILDSGSQGATNDNRIELSDDGRFLVRLGYRLSIWDLHNLSADNEATAFSENLTELPQRCYAVDFIDNQTIEVDCLYRRGAIFHFDALTGERIEQS